jgi:glycosyltransferase involved in cell wall biosynthesis
MEGIMSQTVDVSFVIPIMNEEATIALLYDGIALAMKKLRGNFEVIFIDDGSTDDSINVIKSLCSKKNNVRYYKFRRNFGKSAALSIGFKKTQGDIVFTMDADLQDDPKEIPKFIEKINEGYDLVSGWKKKRKDPLGKRIPSKLFNTVISILSGVRLHDFNCGFKAYKSVVVKNIKVYGDLHRYIPALAYGKGFKVTEIIVEHHPRKFGKSKYGIERFLKGLFDCFTVVFLNKYFQKPMHFFGKMGLVSGSIGFLICLILTINWFGGASIGDRPLLTLGILLIILGAQFVSTGLIGEMILNKNYDDSNIQIEEEGAPKTIKSPRKQRKI